MREATGNALLVGMVTSMIAVIMIFFVGSLSYSKSYRIKNYIINSIEEKGEWNDSMSNEIDDYLKNVGYNVRKGENKCPDVKSNTNNCLLLTTSNSGYDYCVYGCNDGSYKYYKVITFMKFEFPIISETLKFKVQGETKSFNEFN
ncbi:MAG: hypothetical protein J6K21_00245 [Bacilli bacterium]|nr:hypothetical protein [Bacilli bacterium]